MGSLPTVWRWENSSNHYQQVGSQTHLTSIVYLFTGNSYVSSLEVGGIVGSLLAGWFSDSLFSKVTVLKFWNHYICVLLVGIPSGITVLDWQRLLYSFTCTIFSFAKGMYLLLSESFSNRPGSPILLFLWVPSLTFLSTVIINSAD